jgi:hypothetical protein
VTIEFDHIAVSAPVAAADGPRTAVRKEVHWPIRRGWDGVVGAWTKFAQDFAMDVLDPCLVSRSPLYLGDFPRRSFLIAGRDSTESSMPSKAGLHWLGRNFRTIKATELATDLERLPAHSQPETCIRRPMDARLFQCRQKSCRCPGPLTSALFGSSEGLTTAAGLACRTIKRGFARSATCRADSS